MQTTKKMGYTARYVCINCRKLKTEFVESHADTQPEHLSRPLAICKECAINILRERLDTHDRTNPSVW